MKLINTTAAIFATAGFIGVSSADVIGIDNRNGYDADTLLGSGSDFSQFRAVIASMGHTIVMVTDYTNLAGIDALIAQNPHAPDQEYSAGEMASINTFVASGHGMLALGEAGGDSSDHLPNMNQMVNSFGAAFTLPELNGHGLIVDEFESHAVTQGVSQVGIDYYRKVAVSGNTMDLTGDTSDFLAALDGTAGAGNTVFLGDISLWKDPGTGSDYGITDFGNELLLRNIIGYTVPAPSSLALLAGTALITRRRRG